MKKGLRLVGQYQCMILGQYKDGIDDLMKKGLRLDEIGRRVVINKTE